MSELYSKTWQMLSQRTFGESLPSGLDAMCDATVGYLSRLIPRYKRIKNKLEKILVLEKYYANMTESKLKEKTDQLHSIFRLHRESPADFDHAFASIREVAFRKIGERPFPVQITGALALESGCIAEMATGEGKTLTSTLPATISAWRGQGCHVITVNDYLAKRDAEWMGSIYRFCGLEVAYIEQETPTDERRAAYMADITYCTNKEVTADFLRDRLVLGRLKGLGQALLAKIGCTNTQLSNRLVQRRLYYAIIDEADSILIDESVTPLIISGYAPNPEQIESFHHALAIANQMKPEIDYKINNRYREIELTNQGKNRLVDLTKNLGDIWKGARRSREMVNQALTAKEFYHRNKHYLVNDGKVVIIDEFTGRMMPDRTWRDGLHQAIEAKENLEVNPPQDTFARISFQRFFRMYPRICGMTGTATEATAEFWQIYHLPVVSIPTNRPCIRKYLPGIILPTKHAKWAQILKEIQKVHKTGRPILIGTRSVDASEHLSQLLSTEKLEHQVLNAVHHKKEAQIVAESGKFGKITVATNMAGRGTDIKLGRDVAKLGGLHVIAAEPNESARIDRQLFGRGARQGDPGSAICIFSLEDEIVSRYAKNITTLLKKRYHKANHDISNRFIRSIFRLAQSRAERMALHRRKSVLRTDHWLDEQLGFAGKE